MLKAVNKSRADEDISVLITIDHQRWHYLCDCGLASDLTKKDCLNTLAVFISHTHIDHFIGFDNVIRHQVGVGRTIYVCGPPGIAEKVQQKMQAYEWNLIDEGDATNTVYEIHEITGDNSVRISRMFPPRWELFFVEERTGSNVVYSDDSVTVYYTLLDHGTPCAAYLFEETGKSKLDMEKCPFETGPWVKELQHAFKHDKKELPVTIAGKTYKAEELFYLLRWVEGYKFGYIMDHAADAANHARIKALFSGADEVFIECYYKESEEPFAVLNKHSTAKRSAEVMRAAGVKKAVPVHFSRRYHQSPELLESVIREFNEALHAD